MLATLVHVAGSAPRPLGSQMVIADDDSHFGYLSGGCAEHAIAAVGRQSFATGQPAVARFGVDSAYLDVQLPCGSGLDIHYTVDPPPAALAAVVAQLVERDSAALDIDVASGSVAQAVTTALLSRRRYRRLYYPPLALVVVGAGPVAIELARLGILQGGAVTLLSPDPATLAGAAGAATVHLRDSAQLDSLAVDAHTAIVTAFHEHERELAVWRRFAGSPAFYLGALGSARAHAARSEDLRAAGVAPAAIARIRGPAGLSTGGKTAVEIALSIFAECRACYRQRELPELLWEGGPLTAGESAEISNA